MENNLVDLYASNEASFTGMEIPPAAHIAERSHATQVLVNDEIEQMFPSDPIVALSLCINDCPEKKLSIAQEVYNTMKRANGAKKVSAVHALSTWNWAVIRRANEQEKIGGPQTYLQFEASLRFIAQIATLQETILSAREALNDLFLAQTSANPTLWWQDSYTGEIDPESNGEMDANVTAQGLLTDDGKFSELIEKLNKIKIDAREAIAQRDGPKKAAEIPMSENSVELRMAEVYGTKEYNGVLMSTLALRAASGSLGDEDTITEIENNEDREFVPPTLEKSFDPNGDIVSRMDWTAANDYRSYKKRCWKSAWLMFPTDNTLTAEQKQLRYQERNDTFRTMFLNEEGFGTNQSLKEVRVRRNLLSYIKGLMREDIQAAAMYAYPYIIDDPEEGETLSATDVDFLTSEIPGDLMDCIELYEEEISERSGAMNRSGDKEVESIDKYSVEFFNRLAKTMPAKDANPTRTASWQVAYTNAIATGSSQEQAQGTAWAAWRQAMSPAGAAAYEKALSEGADQKKAMTAFWACTSDMPKVKAEITKIKGDGSGVVLSEIDSKSQQFKPLAPLTYVDEKTGEVIEIADPEGFEQPVAPVKITREVTWYVADMKLRAGEIDLSKKDKLVLVLKEKKFPHARYFEQDLQKA